MKKYDEIIDRVIDLYPNRTCELEYQTSYQLLVAVILSAQCTDKRVNQVTRELFKVAPTPEDMLNLGEDKLKKYIYSCGFYNNKSKNIILMTKDLVQKYNSVVPNTEEELVGLSGVGEKTASVVLSTAFNVPAFAVDTHVFRLSKRLGLANENDPHKTMLKLKSRISKYKWSAGHFALVLHGRYCCFSRNPNCGGCELKDICTHYKKLQKENKNVWR